MKWLAQFWSQMIYEFEKPVYSGKRRSTVDDSGLEHQLHTLLRLKAGFYPESPTELPLSGLQAAAAAI